VPDMSVVGWIVVGFFAGALSGAVVDRGGPHGCVANILVGILGGLLGGLIATRYFNAGSTNGFFGALIVAFLGATVIRLILNALEGADGRDRPRSRW
jgi:uncharacterized membrane protein YeaQ/YmgE (transglycosylase-associated protein family)